MAGSGTIRQLTILIAAFVAALGLTASAWLVFGGAASTRRAVSRNDGDGAAGNLPVLAELPEFTLTERSGNPISRDDLHGKVWVADFIFTRCPGPCPAMSRRFAELQRAFRNLDNVRLVSISVDPEHDTPEVLADYAESYGADPERWLFLTGEKEAILDLAVQGFKISAGDDPNLHGTHFVLVDRRGHIRAFYRSSDDETLAQLRRDVRRLAKEPTG